MSAILEPHHPFASTATLHASRSCQDSIHEAAYRSRWLPSNIPRNSQGLEAAQQVLTCCPRNGSEPSRGRCLTYVRNQKAASKLIFAGLQRSFPQLQCSEHKEPYLQDLTQESIRAAAFTFTVVRDPIATAVAAYCEIDRRDPPVPHRTGTSLWFLQNGLPPHKAIGCSHPHVRC